MYSIVVNADRFTSNSANIVHGFGVFTSNGTWVCPEGVYSICISGVTPGNGGNGGGAVNGGNGGNAGVLFMPVTLSVIPGTPYSVVVAGGAPGGGVGIFSFGTLYAMSTPTTQLASASGGLGGIGVNPGTAGGGVQFPGGTGGAASASAGGGGGGAGSLFSTGGNGAAAVAGTPGGGGGGAGAPFQNGGNASGINGGVGGNGIMLISY